MKDQLQHPIDSKFGVKSTAKDVIKGINLSGKNVVMTGGYLGTGIHIVKALASAGASITILVRNTERAKRKVHGIKGVTVEHLDLLLPETITAFTESYLETGKSIDILINHAAVMNIPKHLDKRGYEYHFATNHLGHFQLTNELLPALKKAKGARVVCVASRGHRAGGVIFDDVNFEHTPYDGMRAYGQSKTANVLFAVKLDELLKKDKIRAFAVHPGAIPSTDLFAESAYSLESPLKVTGLRLSAELMRISHATEILNLIRRPKTDHDLYKTVQQGAATTLWAATSPDLDGLGGVYLEDCNVARIVKADPAIPYGVRSYAIDEEYADKLWILSQQMLGYAIGEQRVAS